MAQTEDRRRIASRLVVLQVAVIVVFAALATSFWVLQIVQGQKYVEMAENNHQRTLALRAPRGVLFDRNGKVLVDNRHSFTISTDGIPNAKLKTRGRTASTASTCAS